MRRWLLAATVAISTMVPAPSSAQQDSGDATGQRGDHWTVAGRLLAIGAGAAVVAVGWAYTRPYVVHYLFPTPVPPPQPWSLFGAITAFEAQQAASLGPAIEPVPYYEYVTSGLAGAILGNMFYEIF